MKRLLIGLLIFGNFNVFVNSLALAKSNTTKDSKYPEQNLEIEATDIVLRYDRGFRCRNKKLLPREDKYILVKGFKNSEREILFKSNLGPSSSYKGQPVRLRIEDNRFLYINDTLFAESEEEIVPSKKAIEMCKTRESKITYYTGSQKLVFKLMEPITITATVTKSEKCKGIKFDMFHFTGHKNVMHNMNGGNLNFNHHIGSEKCVTIESLSKGVASSAIGVLFAPIWVPFVIIITVIANPDW